MRNFKKLLAIVLSMAVIIAAIFGFGVTDTVQAASAANKKSTITVRVDGEANQISGYYKADSFWVADSDIVLLTGIKPKKYCKTIAGKISMNCS